MSIATTINGWKFDPLAAALKLVAASPEPIPTMPAYRVPDFADFAPLAALVQADPQAHYDALESLARFRGQISDAVAAGRLHSAGTATALFGIANDLVSNGSKAVALAAPLGPVAQASAVAGLVLAAYKQAEAEVRELEAALGRLAEGVLRDAAEAAAVVLPGSSPTARHGMDQLAQLARPPAHPAAAPEPGPALPAPPMPMQVEPASVGRDAAPVNAPPPAPGGSPAGAAAAQAALAQVGTPYVWGGNQPGGFDCSGLTSWAYAQAGVHIPRTAAEQTVGRQVSYEELQPGDLVLWSGHAAMYVGDGKMVEAGDPVQVNPVRTSNLGMAFNGFWRPTG